jgi:hypothetical protein
MLQGFVVVPLQGQIMLQEAAKHAEEVFDDCMRTKGFTRPSRSRSARRLPARWRWNRCGTPARASARGNSVVERHPWGVVGLSLAPQYREHP